MSKERPVLADRLRHITLDHQLPELDTVLKNDIQHNLKHHLRLYQWGAIINFNWSQLNPDADHKFRQVMFKMATGSGKTDIMAGLILYMYAKGYQYFIYVTKSRGVVDKTKDNFINSNSDKYLFNPHHQIRMNGQQVRIVKGLPASLNNPDKNTIYIDITTIDTLKSSLENGGDNKLTYSDFEGHKLVILADEAHHFNVDTKQHEKQKQDSSSWEHVLDELRKTDLKNRQLEFTATLDYEHNDSLYTKYKHKILYEYSLKQFINQGFAKHIYRLETSDNDHIKVINAILMSQYRKEIAINRCGIKVFKPVILFKSNYVNDSHNAYQSFKKYINSLKTRDLLRDLHDMQRTAHADILKNYVYKYWINRLNNDLQNHTHSVVEELKHNFSANTIVDMNDSNRKDILSDSSNFKRINSLEDPNNPIRVIFCVAKLTEGWDVLNLYDIVRLKENVKRKKSNSTDSEAQLIGRGSRYYPFKYHGKRVYHRRFSSDDSIQKQLLERLYYHTIKDSKYLRELQESLDSNGVPAYDANNLKTATAHLKPGFMNSRVYKYGYLFQNETVKRKTSEKTSFNNCGIPTGKCIINDNKGIYESNVFDNNLNTQDNVDTRRVIDKGNGLLSDDLQLTRVAMQKLLYFFNFQHLHYYFPPLKSLHEFMTSSKWLGGIQLNANVDSGSDLFTSERKTNYYAKYREEQLDAVIKYFESQLMTQIRTSKTNDKGTKVFKPRPINKLLPTEYTKEVYNVNSNKNKNKNKNNDWLAHTISYSMNHKGQSWFVYDNAIVDHLEYQCIGEIDREIVKPLQNKHTHIFLIRNDEQKTQLKLHSFKDIQYSHGYMPDFVLYVLKDDYPINLVYQIYVEPKGPQLVEQDKWKEKLLESIQPKLIKPNPLIISTKNQNSRVLLYGVPFYVNTYNGSNKDKFDTHHMFKELHKILFK